MSLTLPPGYALRPATMADVEAVADLLNAAEIAEHGEPDFTVPELRELWIRYGDRLAAIVKLVTAPDGTLAGYGAVTDRAHVGIDLDIYVHPAHQGRGLGAFLLREALERARAHIPLAPPAAQVTARNWISAHNPAARERVEREGFTPVRHFWRMEIELTDPPPAPVWPAGFAVRPFVPGRDERAVYQTVTEAFRDHWRMGPERGFAEWLTSQLGYGYDPDFWVQVVRGDEVVAALIGRRFDDQDGWIRSVAVRRPWRRRGLAKAMLRHAFGLFYERGFRRVALGVDAQNPTGATRLYDDVGMRIVREHIAYELILRDGIRWDDDA